MASVADGRTGEWRAALPSDHGAAPARIEGAGPVRPGMQAAPRGTVNPPRSVRTFLGIDSHGLNDYRRAAFRDVTARKVVCAAVVSGLDRAESGRSGSAHDASWALVARWGCSHGRA